MYVVFNSCKETTSEVKFSLNFLFGVNVEVLVIFKEKMYAT